MTKRKSTLTFRGEEAVAVLEALSGTRLDLPGRQEPEPTDYVVYAKCKHGRCVGFCSSNVPARVLKEFCAEPTFVELIKLSMGSPQMSAGYCHACEEDARAAKRSTVEKLRDLNLLAAEAEVR